MKTLKTYTTILICMMLILFTHSACYTEKLLNLQRSRISNLQEKDTHIHTKQTESTQTNRLTLTIDSSNNSYQVNIFPLDTFSFSLEQGFKGKASIIEVVKKSKGMGIAGLIGIGLLILMVWLYWRFWRPKIGEGVFMRMKPPPAPSLKKGGEN